MGVCWAMVPWKATLGRKRCLPGCKPEGLEGREFQVSKQKPGEKVLWADNQKKHKNRGDVRRFVLCVLRNEPLFNHLAQP